MGEERLDPKKGVDGGCDAIADDAEEDASAGEEELAEATPEDGLLTT